MMRQHHLFVAHSIVLSCFTLFFLLMGCGHSSKKHKTDDTNVGQTESNAGERQRPRWILDPYAQCQKNQYLCAVGEAEGLMGAEANARSALAKIFETKIESSMKSTQIYGQESQGDVILSGTMEEFAEKTIQEITNEVLEGVEIVGKHEGADSIYALASLDRMQASKRIKSKIDELDDQLKTLINSGKYSSPKKLKGLYESRESLNTRYQILTGQFLPKAITFEQLEKLRNDSPKPQIKVEFTDQLLNRDLKEFVAAQLVANELKLVKNDSWDYIVQGNFKHEKMFLNVEGFEKHRFDYAIFFKNKNNQKVWALEKTFEINGRNFDHAYDKVLSDFKNYFIQEIQNLNLVH